MLHNFCIFSKKLSI